MFQIDHSALPAVSNGCLLDRVSTRTACQIVNFIQNILPLNCDSESHVLAVVFLLSLEEDPELSSVSVRSIVDHAQHIGLSMLHLEVLVVELFSINRGKSLTSLSITVLFDFIKSDSFEALSFFSSAQCSEVLCSFGDDVTEEFEDNLSLDVAIDGDLEEYFRSAHDEFSV